MTELFNWDMAGTRLLLDLLFLTSCESFNYKGSHPYKPTISRFVFFINIFLSQGWLPIRFIKIIQHAFTITSSIQSILFFSGLFSYVSAEEEFNLELCRSRPSHWRNNQHDYLFSGLLDLGKGLDYPTLPWEEARAFCRKRCMDLVSIEFESEFRLVRKNLDEVGARSVWTSGHICDRSVSERCYTDEGVQPRVVNGWFWSGSGRRLPPTNTTGRGWRTNPWSREGPQPDNKEGRDGGSEEACLAFQDSTFHDLPCSLARLSYPSS